MIKRKKAVSTAESSKEKGMRINSGVSESIMIVSDIIGIDEVCKITSLSRSTIYKKTSNHEIPFYKSTLNKRSFLRFRRSEILNWMLRHRIGTIDEFLESQDWVYNNKWNNIIILIIKEEDTFMYDTIKFVIKESELDNAICFLEEIPCRISIKSTSSNRVVGFLTFWYHTGQPHRTYIYLPTPQDCIYNKCPGCWKSQPSGRSHFAVLGSFWGQSYQLVTTFSIRQKKARWNLSFQRAFIVWVWQKRNPRYYAIQMQIFSSLHFYAPTHFFFHKHSQLPLQIKAYIFII